MTSSCASLGSANLLLSRRVSVMMPSNLQCWLARLQCYTAVHTREYKRRASHTTATWSTKMLPGQDVRMSASQHPPRFGCILAKSLHNRLAKHVHEQPVVGLCVDGSV